MNTGKPLSEERAQAMGLFSADKRAGRQEDKAAAAARKRDLDRAIARDRKSNAIRAKAAAKRK